LTPSKQPTQQQLDSLPAHASTSPLPSSLTQASSSHSSDLDKPRGPASWSHVTAGNIGGNANDHPPNLLGLNDFPRLVTQDSKTGKSSADSLINAVSSTTTTQGPILRPANLSSWKEGGGRVQPLPADSTKDSNDSSNLSSLTMQSPIVPTTTSLLQQPMQNPNHSSYTRGYSQQQQQQQQQSSSSSVNL
jgi:hypothetical protein